MFISSRFSDKKKYIRLNSYCLSTGIPHNRLIYHIYIWNRRTKESRLGRTLCMASTCGCLCRTEHVRKPRALKSPRGVTSRDRPCPCTTAASSPTWRRVGAQKTLNSRIRRKQWRAIMRRIPQTRSPAMEMLMRLLAPSMKSNPASHLSFTTSSYITIFEEPLRLLVTLKSFTF